MRKPSSDLTIAAAHKSGALTCTSSSSGTLPDTSKPPRKPVKPVVGVMVAVDTQDGESDA